MALPFHAGFQVCTPDGVLAGMDAPASSPRPLEAHYKNQNWARQGHLLSFAVFSPIFSQHDPPHCKTRRNEFGEAQEASQFVRAGAEREKIPQILKKALENPVLGQTPSASRGGELTQRSVGAVQAESRVRIENQTIVSCGFHSFEGSNAQLCLCWIVAPALPQAPMKRCIGGRGSHVHPGGNRFDRHSCLAPQPCH